MKTRITPAVVRALANGDVENALIAATPGGIEAQEAAGQATFVASTTLPKEFLYSTREQFEQLGFKFGEDVDDLFMEAQLPDGWKKRPTGHSMWTEMLDSQGRVRAHVFYKAAFYDRRAHIQLDTRFHYGSQPVHGWEYEDHEHDEWWGRVWDYTGTVWTTEKLRPKPSYENREALDKWFHERDKLADRARDWLTEHYPNWQDPVAYWDDYGTVT